MSLECGDDFCPPCEPIAWVWREGDEPIRHCSIAVVDIVDVHLPEVHTFSSVHSYVDMTAFPLTVLAELNVLLLATKW
jgi:hypothetical protein